MKNIILIAAPAAGKGTLSKLLVEKYNYAHISTGDLLRYEVKESTELGKKVASLMESGELVPDDIVFQLLEKRLVKDDTKNGYILDGFPRTLAQAHEYDELLKRLNKDLGVVIVLETEYETLLKRIVGRVSCQECGSIYNTLTDNKPLKENICDHCGGILVKRSDDNEESFKQRYDTYLEKTKPLLEYYQKFGNIHFVDSSSQDLMLKEVEGIIND